MTWTEVGWPQAVATDLEVTFEPVGDRTLVRVAQRGFERIGPEAARDREGHAMGWKELLGWFAEHVNRKESA
jgi:uncharacterized protein YndB with AHSA1/START domain